MGSVENGELRITHFNELSNWGIIESGNYSLSIIL